SGRSAARTRNPCAARSTGEAPRDCISSDAMNSSGEVIAKRVAPPTTFQRDEASWRLVNSTHPPKESVMTIKTRPRAGIARRVRPTGAALAIPAVAVAGFAGTAQAATTAYAQTCYATAGFNACLHSYESWNGTNSASSSGRSYSCGNTPVVLSDCHNH